MGKYVKAEREVIGFAAEDVIAASGWHPDDNQVYDRIRQYTIQPTES